MDKRLKIIILGFVGLFILFCFPYWQSISIASIFAFALYPRIPRKTKVGVPARISVLTSILVTFLVASPFMIGIYAFSADVIDFAKEENQSQTPLTAENLKKTIGQKVDKTISQLNLPTQPKTSQMIEKVSSTAVQAVLAFSISIVKGVPKLVVQVLIFALSLFVFLRYGANIKHKIVSLKLLLQKDVEELSSVLQRSCFSCLVNLLIVGGIQATSVLLGSVIAGMDHLLLIFIVTFSLSFIPVIGAAPVAFALAAFSLFEGEGSKVVILLITGIFAGTIDNVIKPLLIKRGIDMDGAISLIIIIGSIAALGLPGLVIGPVVGMTVSYYFAKHTA